MGEKKKKQKGETYDAYLVKGIEPIQEFMISLLGTRAENEAVCRFDIDLTALNVYLKKLNDTEPKYRYTFFHIFCAALGRTIAERPRMNYFIRNGHFYERKDISLTAVAKKEKADGAEEGFIIMKYNKDSEESPIDQMHNSICSQVHHIRKSADTHDGTTDIMRTLVRLPRPIYRLVVNYILKSDSKGKLPRELVDFNPYSKTCFISNLGSIKMDADYHHLTNFGSNSFFAIIGMKEIRPEFKPDGTYEMKEFLPVSFTIDERIGDGVYFSKTIRMFKKYMTNPELLEIPANRSVDFGDGQEDIDI